MLRVSRWNGSSLSPSTGSPRFMFGRPPPSIISVVPSGIVTRAESPWPTSRKSKCSFPVSCAASERVQNDQRKNGYERGCSKAKFTRRRRTTCDAGNRNRSQRIPSRQPQDQESEWQVIEQIDAPRPSRVMRQPHRRDAQSAERIDQMSHQPVHLFGQHDQRQRQPAANVARQEHLRAPRR